MTNLFDRLQREIDDRERQDGMSVVELLDLSPELRNLVLILARKGQMPADELAAESGLPAEDAERLMEGLAEQGLVRGFDLGERRFYRTYFGHRRHRGVGHDIWAMIEDRTDETDDADDTNDTGTKIDTDDTRDTDDANDVGAP